MSDSEGDASRPPHSTYTEQFYEAFPLYLSFGMTYEQYWEQDCTLVKYYRKAHELRREVKNQELWLQGMYIYEAIGDIAPVLHAFAKRGTKPRPYRQQPYPISEKLRKQQEQVQDQAVSNRGLKLMEALMGVKPPVASEDSSDV